MDLGPTVSHYLPAFIFRLGDDDGRYLWRLTILCNQWENLKSHERYFGQGCYNELLKQDYAPFNYPLICAVTWPQSLLISFKAANDRTFKGCIDKAKLFKYINKTNYTFTPSDTTVFNILLLFYYWLLVSASKDRHQVNIYKKLKRAGAYGTKVSKSW